MKYLLNIIKPNNRFTDKLVTLLSKYPNVDINALGFKENWENEELWKFKEQEMKVNKKPKEKQSKDKPLKIDGTLEDVLKVSVPKPKEKKPK